MTVRQKLMLVLKCLAVALVILVILVILALAWLTLSEWSPAAREPVQPVRKAGDEAPPHLGILTWNMGYGGLDRDADFFVDGGQGAGARDRETVVENLEAVVELIRSRRPDAVLLQEVDRDSSRSFGMDQGEILADGSHPGGEGAWSQCFAFNYRVPWVPVPLLDPMGRVNSGLMVLTRHAPSAAEARYFTGSYSWPVRLFHLKRCALVTRLPADGGSWVLVNVHLSAFDEEGQLRRSQLDQLREIILAEHAGGGKVVVGGDWNHTLPGVAMDRFPSSEGIPNGKFKLFEIPEGWTPEGWTWALDPSTPSFRTTGKPYRKGQSYRGVIDGFLVSPNVEVVKVSGIDLDFEHSDHNPVLLEVRAR